MTADVETVVVGAGVVGLAIARALAAKGQEVLVIERHDRIGSETSSRNSEVIHAGIYYPTGSLRAKLCVPGKAMLYRFLEENGVAHVRCGKLLVATQEAEIPKLQAIAKTAEANGVGDMRFLSAAEARALEPEVACVAACLSPSTGVLDSHGLMQALEGHLTAAGGSVVLNTAVTGLACDGGSDAPFRITTENAGETSSITANRLVIAGGLSASLLGDMLTYAGDYRPPRTYPARGHYFSLARRAPFKHLVYPMPQGAWLGVHLTLDTSGRAKFGPDIEWCDEVSYAFHDPDGERRLRFMREVRRYWPGLPDDALQPDYVGVRPKLYREGEPVADFRIDGPDRHGIPRLVALYGIESPGLTSSLALGDLVASMI